MICVNIALVYHCFRAWHSPQSTLYWPFVVAGSTARNLSFDIPALTWVMQPGMGCYLKARRSKTKTEVASTFLHELPPVSTRSRRVLRPGLTAAVWLPGFLVALCHAPPGRCGQLHAVRCAGERSRRTIMKILV